MMKGPTFNDCVKRADEITTRHIEVHATGLEHTSSNTIYFDCPFCKNEVKAYVWSLTGGGKRCPDCGALITGRSGAAKHFTSEIENIDKKESWV